MIQLNASLHHGKALCSEAQSTDMKYFHTEHGEKTYSAMKKRHFKAEKWTDYATILEKKKKTQALSRGYRKFLFWAQKAAGSHKNSSFRAFFLLFLFHRRHPADTCFKEEPSGDISGFSAMFMLQCTIKSGTGPVQADDIRDCP